MRHISDGSFLIPYRNRMQNNWQPKKRGLVGTWTAISYIVLISFLY